MDTEITNETQHSDIPAAIDTPEVEKVVTEVHADVTSLASQAKADVKSQIDTAVTAAGKLLAIAAGDATSALSDAEAAAISVVVHNVPPSFQPIVSAFASAAASKAEGVANAAADAAVQNGLAWSLSWLKTLQASADKALS